MTPTSRATRRKGDTVNEDRDEGACAAEEEAMTQRTYECGCALNDLGNEKWTHCPIHGGLTQAESGVLSLTAEIWNRFCELPQSHPDERQEFKTQLHALQNIVMARPTLRRERVENPPGRVRAPGAGDFDGRGEPRSLRGERAALVRTHKARRHLPGGVGWLAEWVADAEARAAENERLASMARIGHGAAWAWRLVGPGVRGTWVEKPAIVFPESARLVALYPRDGDLPAALALVRAAEIVIEHARAVRGLGDFPILAAAIKQHDAAVARVIGKEGT